MGEAASSVDLAASECRDDAVWDLLLRQTSEKFSDLEASDDFGQLPSALHGRMAGAIRRGEIVWRSDPERGSAKLGLDDLCRAPRRYAGEPAR